MSIRPAAADTVVKKVDVGQDPVAVAVDQATNKVYVTNEGSNDVTVIDGAALTTTKVDVGTQPVAVEVNQTTEEAYVATKYSNEITILKDDRILSKLETGDNPIR